MSEVIVKEMWYMQVSGDKEQCREWWSDAQDAGLICSLLAYGDGVSFQTAAVEGDLDSLHIFVQSCNIPTGHYELKRS